MAALTSAHAHSQNQNHSQSRRAGFENIPINGNGNGNGQKENKKGRQAGTVSVKAVSEHTTGLNGDDIGDEEEGDGEDGLNTLSLRNRVTKRPIDGDNETGVENVNGEAKLGVPDAGHGRSLSKGSSMGEGGERRRRRKEDGGDEGLIDGTAGHDEIDGERPRKKARNHAGDGQGEGNGNGSGGTATKKSDKRTLRSQDGGSRFKSDLAVYFPGLLEEMLGQSERKPELVGIDTPILIVDDVRSQSLPTPKQSIANKLPILGGKWRASALISPFLGKSTDALHENLTNAKTIDLSSIELATKNYSEDPLPDELFEKAHRRAERSEKQLRNIEKERAQHEKHHLERLLEGLKGHDWLKVMGITGVTDTEKREYEPKRAILIREVAALVEKFRLWKEEEKRRKAERDAAAAHSAEVDGANTQDGHDSDNDPPDFSDVDASAARQLHLEAIRANSSVTKARKIANHKRIASSAANAAAEPKAEPEEPPPKPFTSFYAKAYLRTAALSNNRKNPRNVTAFGQAVPELAQVDFALPDDMTQGKTYIESQRRRRRLKRDSEKDE